MEQLVLPDLYYPFPSAISEHSEAVHEHTVDWALRFGLLPGERAHRLFEATGIGRLVALTHPDASLNDLKLISDWYAWLFLQDDMRDESEVSELPGQLSTLNGLFLDILEGGEPTEYDEPLAYALYNLRERLHQRLHLRVFPSTWMRRFIRAVKVHFEATLWEATNRACAITPDIESYVRMRPLTGGLFIVTELIEAIEGNHLPMEVREHAMVGRLTEASHNVVCWANDILSLGKELRHGEVNNLVMVLRHEYELTLQQAVDLAAEMHDAEVRTFVELEKRLPSFGPEVDANLRRYVCGLRARIRGVLEWSYESERYGTGVGAASLGEDFASVALQR